MYIKEIKTSGFKSFADKINIELNKTFTGIVGPNGSGKSNVVDAIKWVLGEQSIKTLRGTSGMTDVIFAGSKKRNAASSASVTIVFDNSDLHLPTEFTEVSIKRVVYKSGDNEYFLNGEKCRLKDITNLFVDSFSSKESINIISQGKVQEIVSNRPEERRAFLEEAAGVLKYKRRKEESLKKLAKTHENIERVNMILSEINDNLEPLKEQAEKAKIYKEAKDNLKNIEVALAVIDINKYNIEFKEKEARVEELTKLISEYISTNSKDTTLIEELKLEQIKLDEDINTLQTKLNDSNNLLSSLSEKKELTKERSKYNTENSLVKNNLINLKETKLSLENKVKVNEIELKESEEELNTNINNLNNYNKEYNEFNSKRSDILNKYNNAIREEFDLKNKIEILENNIKSNSRIPYSVKSILNNPRLNGVIDIIGNIIDVEEEYSTMLEIALGSASNFVITENEKASKEAITYLKTNKLGRATFFPINIIKPKSIDPATMDRVQGIKGYIGVASKLIKFDSKYSNIVNNQLGNIIVTSDLDSANDIGKIINFRYRIVTLDGELVHTGGSLTGGAFKSKTSMVGDKFELQRISSMHNLAINNKNKYETALKECEIKLENYKEEIYKLTASKVRLNEEQNNKELLFNENKNKLEKIKEEIKVLSMDSKEQIETEIESIMNEYFEEESNNKIISKNLEDKNKKRRDLLEDIIEKENLIKKANGDYSKYSDEQKKLEIENIKLGNNIDKLLEMLTENYSMTFEMASEYNLDIEEDEARKQVNSLKRTIKSVGEVNLGSIEEYERVSTRHQFLNAQKEDLLESENNLLKIINDMDNTMKDKFIKTYHQINEEFNKVFNKLFSGGEATLELTDPENILETGVEIKAVPPGKKLTNINLLSGGEKSLTAISLLFAIMNLNDVPFAILDEVEAALDEANVVRFGEYLENYRDQIQLLIITHKKKTMEHADTLYGITMQEGGVSKLVSVKLEDA